MSTLAAAGTAVSDRASLARRASIRLAMRLVRRGALILVVLTAGLTGVVVVQYAATFATPDAARSLQALAENPAIRTLFGVPRALDEAGGFTVWRTGTIAAVAIGAWALAAATRLTRGEEDSGRAWLILAGPLRLRSAVLIDVSIVAAGAALFGAAVGLAMIFAGASPSGAVVYGAGLAGIGVWFAAVGAVSGQLVGRRRAATGLAAAVMLLGLLVRMIADGVDSVGWASWLTPFGLLSLSRPYDGDHLVPLVVLAVEAVALAALAWLTAGRRDVGGGLISVSEQRRPRLGLLGSPAGFATRRILPALAGWSLALGSYFLLIGLLAVSLTDFLGQNRRFADLAAQAGFAALATVQGYAAALLMLIPIPVGLFAAARIAGVAADEAERRLALLLARPVGRGRWVATETVAVGLAALLITMVAGGSVWLGTRAVGAPLELGEAVLGALNVLPVASLSLGAAVLALGWLPRAVMLVGALPVVGGFVVWTLGDTLDWPVWLRQVSPFAHVAAVPAEPPDWPGTWTMLALAAALAVIGIAGFRRRDLLA